MQDSIFTKIIKGEIPCHKVYEDDRTLAFLDIHPVRPGHTLVVPKIQVDHLWDLSPEEYAAVMATVQQVAQRIQAVLQPVRVGAHVAGFDVPHAHVHLFPFDTADQFWIRPNIETEPNHPALVEMAKKLAF